MRAWVETVRIRPEERRRFLLLALLLAACALVQECGDIVATSGLVSGYGSSSVLWVWTLDAVLAAGGSLIYALVVDRMDRVTLAVRLLYVFGIGYLLLFGLFCLKAPSFLTHGGLLVLNNQQTYLAVVLIWTLAKDVFTVQQAARLFGLLGSTTLIGSLLGNLIATAAGHWRPEVTPLLLPVSAGLTLGCGALIAGNRSQLAVPRQTVEAEVWIRGLSVCLRYLWQERAYRYLGLATLTTGVVWTMMTFQLLSRLADAVHANPHPGALQSAYGLFTLARPIVQAVIQAAFAGWLVGRIGFQRIFALTPLTLLLGVALMAFSPGVASVAIGLYLLYIVFGVEEPAAHAFLTQVPDHLRGRISALIEGCLAPAGYVIGCLAVALTQAFSTSTAGSAPLLRASMLLLALLFVATGLWAARQLYHCQSAPLTPAELE